MQVKRFDGTFTQALRWIGLLGLLAFCAPATMQAETGRLIECHWNSLPPLIGKQIVLLLPDGTHVGGEVREVMNDGLHLAIKSSSDPLTHPRGVTWMPRVHIREIEVRKKVREWKTPDESYLAKWGKIMGGIYGAKYGAFRTESERGLLAGMFAGGAAGAYVGGKISGAINPREDVDVIRVLPDPPGESTGKLHDSGPLFGETATAAKPPIGIRGEFTGRRRSAKSGADLVRLAPLVPLKVE